MYTFSDVDHFHTYFNCKFILLLFRALTCDSIFWRLTMACDRLCSESSCVLMFINSDGISICDIIPVHEETILCECESGMLTSSKTLSIIRQGSVSESNISVESESSGRTNRYATVKSRVVRKIHL